MRANTYKTLAFLAALAIVQSYHVAIEWIPLPDYAVLVAGFAMAFQDVLELWDKSR